MKNIKLVLFTLYAIGIFSSKTNAQCAFPGVAPDVCGSCVHISLPFSVDLCAGSSYVVTPGIFLPPGFTIDAYGWSGPGIITPASGTGIPGATTITPPIPLPCTTVGYPYSLSVSALGPNMIHNPDFNLGNINFCSGYNFMPFPPPGLPVVNYTVGNNTGPIPGYFPPCTDHTGGGQMMILNGDPNMDVAWQQSIDVCGGETYKFTYWVTNFANFLYPFNPANLHVNFIDGLTTTSPFYTVTGTNFWQQVTVFWTAPPGPPSTVTIQIASQFTLAWGTPFGLDDIAMSRVCKTAARMVINVENPDITGPSNVCEGSTITMNGCPAFGTFSSGNTSIATIDPGTGVLTGVSAGVVGITYVSPLGCIATTTVQVDPLPSPMPSVTMCVGSSMYFPVTPAGGAWLSSNPPVADVVGGIVTAYSAGTAIISYTTAAGCVGTCTITVTNCPGGGLSGGGGILCPPTLVQPAGVTTLIGSPAGGSWSTSDPSVATVNAFGTVTAVGPGIVTICYTVTIGFSTYTYCTTLTVPAAPIGCIYSGFDAFGNYVFNYSGTPGATLYLQLQAYGGPVVGYTTQVIPVSGVITIPWSAYANPAMVRICIDSIELYGCYWPCTCPGPWGCCASVNPLGHKGGSITASDIANVSVKPNPNTGTFTISGYLPDMADSKEVKIEMTSILGKTVYTTVASLVNGEMDKKITLGNDIPNGIYFIKVNNESSSQIIRFVLTR